MTLRLTVTDMYCGAGGSTTGATLAGAEVCLAINHWKRAIETHNTNYPHVTHIQTDLQKANPRRFPSTTLLIASPECTAMTLAKGRKRKEQRQLALPWEAREPDLEAEAEERSRCTMWTPLDWAEYHDYQAVILENVVDAHLWRPFQSWLHAWGSLDYEFELVYLNSLHTHPTPQSRDRMYFVAWKRGNRKPNLTIRPRASCPMCATDVDAVQSWKKPNRRYGKYKRQYVYRCPQCAGEVVPYYYAAANAIDWSLPAPRIGDRARPLREKTLQRIADGLEKVAGDPFLLALNHPTTRTAAIFTHPFPTQTAYDDVGMTVPPFVLDHLGEYRPRSIAGPLSTICAAGNHHSVVVPPSWLMTYYRHGQMAPLNGAVPTVTTLPRHALVTLAPQAHPSAMAVEECGFRMLAPREIQAAMAFPAEYVVMGTRREQVKQLGNAVTPPVMKLLMERVIAAL